MQVSETFFVDLGDGKGRLQEQTRLDNCVTVVDASALRLHLQTDDDMKFIDPRAQGKEAEQHISYGGYSEVRHSAHRKLWYSISEPMQVSETFFVDQ